jgi:hypothetical protein
MTGRLREGTALVDAGTGLALVRTGPAEELGAMAGGVDAGDELAGVLTTGGRLGAGAPEVVHAVIAMSAPAAATRRTVDACRPIRPP